VAELAAPQAEWIGSLWQAQFPMRPGRGPFRIRCRRTRQNDEGPAALMATGPVPRYC